LSLFPVLKLILIFGVEEDCIDLSFMTKRILSEIWIYPVKSLGGMRISSASVREKGLQHDRRWMLVDDDGVFMTQRNCPTMALLRVHAQGSRFVITRGKESIDLPINFLRTSPAIQARIWNDTVTTVEVSDDHSKWFSDRLGIKCRLVSFPEENKRPVNPAFSIANEQVSLADGYPLLVIGQSSLDDLNGQLENPLPMNRFRPNLVFTGGTPYEEDGWRKFTIGNNRFAGVKPCSRCPIPTINQDTAEKGLEPLTTLATYRKRDGEVYFGQNVVAIDHYEIHEGDEIKLE
jgi:uncharacterized protein YcbX